MGIERTNRRFLAYTGLWLLLFLFFLGLMAGRPIKYFRLAINGQRTEGVAIATELHRQIKYSFTDGTREYTSVGMLGLGTPPFERISLGEHLPVYYLPGSPEISCLGDPQDHLHNELPGALVVPFLFPTFIVIAAYHARRAKKERTSQSETRVD